MLILESLSKKKHNSILHDSVIEATTTGTICDARIEVHIWHILADALTNLMPQVTKAECNVMGKGRPRLISHVLVLYWLPTGLVIHDQVIFGILVGNNLTCAHKFEGQNKIQ